MLVLPIISVVCCIAYIIYILFTFGVPVSLSETYYLLPNKIDWLFGAWCVTTAGPFGLYWFNIAQQNHPELLWIPIVCVIAMLFVGVSCRYKSDTKEVNNITGHRPKSDSESIAHGGFWRDLASKFKPSEFLKYGWARPIHYVSSLLIILLSTIYICIIDHTAILSTILLYSLFILIGLKVDGVYNERYSVDVDNRAWIFMIEVVCFINLFIFVWA